MTPLLPTLGQDFGEVGQKPSYAALYNLLLKFPKKTCISDLSSMFVFIPSSDRFIKFAIQSGFHLSHSASDGK